MSLQKNASQSTVGGDLNVAQSTSVSVMRQNQSNHYHRYPDN